MRLTSREADRSFCIPSLMQASRSGLIFANHRPSDDPKHWQIPQPPQLLGAQASLVGWLGVFKQTGFLAVLFLELQIEPCICSFSGEAFRGGYNNTPGL